MKEFIFVDDLEHEWNDILFGPFHGREVWVKMEPNWTWEDIWVHVGLFKSKTQARKNTSNEFIGEIQGFHHVIKKKQALNIAVFRERVKI